MKKKKSMAEAVDGYSRFAEAEFPLAELVGLLQKPGVEIDEDEVCDLAATSDYLFETNSLDETFIPRRTFFQGAQFRVTPLKEEVEGGFVVPGHRFFPFVSREIFPADARLVLPDGSALRTRSITLPQDLAMRFLLFCGQDGTIKYLLADYEGNADALKPPFTGEIKLTTFDLRDFFAQSGFRLGDSLMLTVLDWLHGVFSVAHVPATTDLAAGREWIQSLRRALDEAMDLLGTEGDCYEQLAMAIKFAQDDPDCIPLARNPPLSLAAAMNSQKDLAVKNVAGAGLFWEVNDDPTFAAAMDAMVNPRDPDSELDAYFQSLGLSVIEAEAEAYMRDALYRGVANPEEVFARIAAGRTLFFDSAENQQEFHNLWAELWDDVRQDYSRKDDNCADMRAEFLKINDRCLSFLRRVDGLGLGLEALGTPALSDLGRLNSLVSSSLVLLNLPQSGGPPPPHFSEMISMLNKTVDKLTECLVEGEASTPTSAGGGRIYQLKVSLKGAKPPIWRRILVPANMELTNLHNTIQAAMGWHDCHLHQFKQGRTCFQPDPDLDFAGLGGFEDEDSAGVKIGDLLRSEKDKIAYEYDFGDGWEHTVLLEKIQEPEEGMGYPICIGGKRACPPEDCGGLWGYYNLLEVLADPKADEHESMLEWVGGNIDPESFNLAEANARLSRYFKN